MEGTDPQATRHTAEREVIVALSFVKLLRPGMQLKRWVLLMMAGFVLTSLGVAYEFTHIYRVQPLPEVAGVLTFQFIERPLRGALFFLLGAGVIAIAALKLNQSLVAALVQDDHVNPVDRIAAYRARNRGPKIVALGGGTGLSMALRGLKECTGNLTAIVTVADDGGSSGRLRRNLGVPPPGDLRNCMVALADVEPLMENLFQYRFNHGSELDGHSFGNLFIVAMTGVTGNFEQALQESSRVLAVRGKVLPSTLADVTLCAEMEDSATVEGESKITESGNRIQRVYLQPCAPEAQPDAVKAILDADFVVVGPGSLYTSLIPNLLVPGIAKALIDSRAYKVYVCNVATQPGETDGYGIEAHVDGILRHLEGVNPFDAVLANNRLGLPMPASGRVAPVRPIAPAPQGKSWPRVIFSDIVDEQNSVRHDSTKLSEALMRMFDEHGNHAMGPKLVGRRVW
jgi:uncharacterized cofD-like protein